MKSIFTVVCVLLVSTGVFSQIHERSEVCFPSDKSKKYFGKDIFHISIKCSEDGFKSCQDMGTFCQRGEVILNKSDKKFFSFINKDTAVIANHFFSKLPSGYTTEGFKIRNACYFNGVDFYATDFDGITFQKDVSFSESNFLKDSKFENASFDKESYFFNTFFLNKTQTNFGKAKFKDISLFDNSYFASDVSFYYSVFQSKVTFKNVNFQKNVSFASAIFTNLASFRGVNFTVLPNFGAVQLPDTLDFRYVSFNLRSDSLDFQENDKLDFRRTAVERLRGQNDDTKAKCKILISGTDISRLLIPYDRFKVVFDSTYSYEQIVSTYEILISSCKEAGMIESVEGWDIEYRRIQNIHNYWFLGFGYFVNFFNWAWWDFGYSKWRILIIWLPLFFLLFWLYNYCHIKRLWDKMYKDIELGSNFKDNDGKVIEPNFKNWRRRLSFSFFYTAVIYFGFKIRHESVNYNYTRGLLYLYFMYAIGTIHMAFAFSYILSAY